MKKHINPNTSQTVSSYDSEYLKSILLKSVDVTKIQCPYCSSIKIIKNGFRDNKQRYICKECNKSFVQCTKTITERSKIDLEKWELFIECMCNQMSIRKAAQICGIHRNTAFLWKKKIENCIKSN